MNNDTLSYLESYANPVLPHAAPPSWASQHVEELKWINTSSFDFALKMRLAYMRWGSLTPGQLDAVHNCMRVDAEIKRTQAHYAPEPKMQLDLTKVPSGFYAVPDGATRLKVKIARGTGRWQGYIFVSDGAVYGQAREYGRQAPGGRYTGQIIEPLLAIAGDPQAASVAYGRLTGSCGICNRPLENQESLDRGIGPICAGRLGW